MANRVNVNLNANDLPRTGLNSLNRSLWRLQRQARRAGTDIRFNVRLDDNATRAQIRRVRRALRGRPITRQTRLDPPTPPATTLRRRIAATLGRAITLPVRLRSEEHTSELQSLMRNSYAVFCLKKKKY